MKLLVIAAFGLFAGAVLAIGQLPAAGLAAAGRGLLLLVGAYWLTLLPWLLAALFARLWWIQRLHTQAWRGQSTHWLDQLIQRDIERDQERVRAAQQRTRKRATR